MLRSIPLAGDGRVESGALTEEETIRVSDVSVELHKDGSRLCRFSVRGGGRDVRATIKSALVLVMTAAPLDAPAIARGAERLRRRWDSRVDRERLSPSRPGGLLDE